LGASVPGVSACCARLAPSLRVVPPDRMASRLGAPALGAAAAVPAAGMDDHAALLQNEPRPRHHPDNDALEIRLVTPESTEEYSGAEGSIMSMPKLAWSRPSDRAARRKAVEGRLQIAQEISAAEAMAPLLHGRCAIVGLCFLEAIRAIAWLQGTIPGYSVFGMHFLTTTADMACIVCGLPLFVFGTQSQCVMMGCLGPMLTLVFAMSLVDICALGAYCVVATPRPLSPEARSYADALEACVGAWEFALVASVALELALCASSWRVYRELRVSGLYPPGAFPTKAGKAKGVSVMEMMCEAEDVEFCRGSCENVLQHPLVAFPRTAKLTIEHADDASLEQDVAIAASSLQVDTETGIHVDDDKTGCTLTSDLPFGASSCGPDAPHADDMPDETCGEETHSKVTQVVNRARTRTASFELATTAITKCMPPRTSSREVYHCAALGAYVPPNRRYDIVWDSEDVDGDIDEI